MSYRDLTLPLMLDTPIDADGSSTTQIIDNFLAEISDMPFERVKITEPPPQAPSGHPGNGKIKELVNKRILIRPVNVRNSHLHLKRGVVRGLFGDKNDPRYVHVYIEGLTHMVTKDEVQVIEEKPLTCQTPALASPAFEA